MDVGVADRFVGYFLNRYIPESPRYLASKGLTSEARLVLQRFSGVQAQDQSSIVVEEEPASEQTGFKQLLEGHYAGITLGLVAAGVAWGLVNFGFMLWLPTNLGEMGLAGQASAIITKSAFLHCQAWQW